MTIARVVTIGVRAEFTLCTYPAFANIFLSAFLIPVRDKKASPYYQASREVNQISFKTTICHLVKLSPRVSHNQ